MQLFGSRGYDLVQVAVACADDAQGQHAPEQGDSADRQPGHGKQARRADGPLERQPQAEWQDGVVRQQDQLPPQKPVGVKRQRDGRRLDVARDIVDDGLLSLPTRAAAARLGSMTFDGR